jgi:serine/threonine protein kinase
MLLSTSSAAPETPSTPETSALPPATATGLSNSTTDPSPFALLAIADNPFLASMAADPALAQDPLLSSVASWLQARSSGAVNQKTALMRRESSTFRCIAIDDIAIKQRIGEGSFGAVYQAQWDHTPVALKILSVGKKESDQTAAQQVAMAALEKEAGLMAELHHPNVVHFLGISEWPNPAIVTEWCARGSLYDVIDKAKKNTNFTQLLHWRRRLAMAMDAAKGMLYLHRHTKGPILHRDLKSPNLLVVNDWSVKVADFNLSKIAQEQGLTSATASVTCGGPVNPRWLAPESLGDENNHPQFSPASDVFAFGVVMWELMCWSKPWTGYGEWAIGFALRDGKRPEIPPADELPGGTFPGLPAYVALMQRCWAQEPADRPDFGQVLEELHNLPL